MRYHSTILMMLTGLAAAACDAGFAYDWEPAVGDVHTLKNGIAMHETQEDTLYYLDARINDPTVARLFAPKSGERILWSAPGPEASSPSQLFVMTGPDDERDTSLEERFWRVTTDGRKPTAFQVGTPFDQLTFSPDGRYAILYHGAQNESRPGFYNANEVALIDLSLKPSATNPRTLNVAMDGRRIEKVSFVSSLVIGGRERRLVVFMGSSVVRVVDLDDPETWVKVPLLPKNDPREIVPLQLIALDETPGCGDPGCEAKLFIRASGTEDVYYITLGSNADSFEGTQSKQLEAGGVPLDMEIVREGEATLLVILSSAGQSSKINVVDIDTGVAFAMTVDDALNQMRLQAGDPDKLVLYGNNAAAVHFLRIPEILEERGRNLSKFTVQGRASSVMALDDSRLLIIPGGGGLMLLDLVTEKAVILSASGEYDWTGAQIHEDIFFLVPETGDRVDLLDLATGKPSSMLLDDYTRSLHLVTGRGTGVAFHDTASGRATLFPLDNPTRGKAKVVDGFWLAGLLDKKEVE